MPVIVAADASTIEEFSNVVGNPAAYTLEGATTGYFRFADAAYADGATITYRATDGVTREDVTGVFDRGANTLSRATILDSTNGGAPVVWGGRTRALIRPLLIAGGDTVAFIFNPTVVTALTKTRTQIIIYTPTPPGDKALTIPAADAWSGYDLDIAFLGTYSRLVITPASGTVGFKSPLTLQGGGQVNLSLRAYAPLADWIIR